MWGFLRVSYSIPLSSDNPISILNKRLFYSSREEVCYPLRFLISTILLIIGSNPLSGCLRCGKSLSSSENFFEIYGRLGLNELVQGVRDSSTADIPFDHGS